MQPRFSAIFASPLRFGAYETNACSIGLIVNAPVCGEDHLYIRFCKKLRCPMRPVENAHFPMARVSGNCIEAWRVILSGKFSVVEMNDIA